MYKLKKGIAMVMAYFMLISILPVGVFTSIANAEENVPKYLNYNDLYFNSVAQYGDKTLVAYTTDGNLNYSNLNYSNYYDKIAQLSVFENGNENKIAQYESAYEFRAAGSSVNFIANENLNYQALNYKFDFLTRKVDQGFPLETALSAELKNDIICKINAKYNTNYNAQLGAFYCQDTFYDPSGNMYNDIRYSVERGTDFKVISAENNVYITDSIYTINSFDSDGNLVVYDFAKGKMTRIKDSKIISEGTLENNGQFWGSCFANGDNAYVIQDNTLNKYVLNNGKYDLVEAVHKYVTSMNQDAKGNLWFLAEEDGRNFVFKIVEGQAIKKYEVSKLMKYLFVYDDSNLVATSLYGSTIINTGAASSNVVTKPEVKNVDGSTAVTLEKLTPNTTNVIVVPNAQKEVVVNLKDIETIKSGIGSTSIQLSNGTTINVPFSIIDKSVLEGATNVKVKFNTIDNADLTKGLKAVNKVFEFNLEVEYPNKPSVLVHKFAKGQAEATFTLTDDDLKGLDKTKLKVLYYNEETKKYEVLETKVEGNKITFKTPHFSKFIVAEVDNDNQPVKATTALVKTGDTNSTRNMIFIGMAALVSLGAISVIGYLNFKKKK